MHRAGGRHTERGDSMDSRFDTSTDPRFKRVPKDVQRLKVDKRFAHMFNDKRFVETPQVDSRGQRLRKGAEKSKLRNFYEVEEEDEVEEEQKKVLQGNSKTKRKQKKQKNVTNNADVQGLEEEEDEHQQARQVEDDSDIAAEMESEEEDDEEADDEEEEEEDDFEPDTSIWERNEEEVPQGDATRRLAVMGCDWDHVSAGDVLLLLRNYLSSKESQKGSGLLRGGTVEKVSVYPSDYGLEQLAKEAQAGPVGVTEAKSEIAAEGEDDEAAQNEAMRRYQLQRTRYYYALAECDSVATASWLYDHLDGLDVDTFCPGCIDLRFVPDDIALPHEPVSTTTEVPKQYQATNQQSSAAGHTKVKCTWDEAPVHRKRDLMRKKYSPQEMMEMDLNAYLASTSEEEDSAGCGAEALKKLVRGSDDEAGDGEGFFQSGSDDENGNGVQGNMEATFSVTATRLEEELADKAKQQAQATKGKSTRIHTLQSDEPKGVWEQYLEKRKMKRRERKAKAKEERATKKAPEAHGQGDKEKTKATKTAAADAGDLELLAMDEEEESRGFNVRGPQRTAARRAKAEVPGGDFKVNAEDPRLAKLFSGGDFDIDPTNPEFRPSEGMAQLLRKKRARKASKSRPNAQTQDSPARADVATPAESSNLKVTASGVTNNNSAGDVPGTKSTSSGGFTLFGGKASQRVTTPKEDRHKPDVNSGAGVNREHSLSKARGLVTRDSGQRKRRKLKKKDT